MNKKIIMFLFIIVSLPIWGTQWSEMYVAQNNKRKSLVQDFVSTNNLLQCHSYTLDNISIGHVGDNRPNMIGDFNTVEYFNASYSASIAPVYADKPNMIGDFCVGSMTSVTNMIVRRPQLLAMEEDDDDEDDPGFWNEPGNVVEPAPVGTVSLAFFAILLWMYVVYKKKRHIITNR